MMTSEAIRQQFLDFFVSKQHHIVPSAPIVIKNDPTLLFTNAGMNQFKDLFLGNRKPEYTRVADTQKCLRVSGKHNDLEEVGTDTYHHTMFEMLGNWSFGDYFKKEAVEWSWELLTQVYELNKDRLYVTVFEGDEKENLPKDDEAIAEWKKWIDDDRILLFGRKDNFWEMGDTGPCGPCTEIHVDGRSNEERQAIDGRTLVNTDHPQVIEIWNNVFIQFNRLKNGTLEPLPSKHVDTGMGFERLVRVIQQKSSNYDTDVFSGSIALTAAITGKTYYATDSKSDIAFRVLADHLRAICFTIADGQLPANTGAGYVIRRVLRRAVRYYYSWLDYKQPLLYQLVPGLAKQFENVFPELALQQAFVAKVVKEEEEAFLRTLDKGLKKIDSIFSALLNAGSTVVDGKAAFELFDTFGFPVDLTRLIAAEHGLQVNEAAFNEEMLQQKTRSKAAAATETEDWIVLDENASGRFVGYDTLDKTTKVLKYRKIKTKVKEAYQVVLEATPFYAESGGQVGDKGSLFFDETEIQVYDTKKENNLIVHFTDALPPNIDAEVLARVNEPARAGIQAHHTATHLLHAALRKVLGNHVAQKGSLVNDNYLRFDFSHFAKVSNQELSEIEDIVNNKILQNIPVIIKETGKDEAIAMGAMALFGEKYGDKVRVVIIDPQYSIELCGGTHAGSTGQLGLFKIQHESAVAAGVRRIEAVSGRAAQDLIKETFHSVELAKELLKNPKDLVKAIENLQAENNDLRRKVESIEARQLSILAGELAKKAQQVNGIDFIGEIVAVESAESLKKLCFELKREFEHFVFVLACVIETKSYVAVMIDDDTVNTRKLEAPSLIKNHVAALIKGGGGGQKTLATAGGQETSNLPQVIQTIKSLL